MIRGMIENECFHVIQRQKCEEEELKMDRCNVYSSLKCVVLCVSTILLLSVMAQTGIVKAEVNVVDEYGGLQVELRPEFESVSYLVEDEPEHIERFHGELELDLGSGELKDGKYHHSSSQFGDNPTVINSEYATLDTDMQPFDEITFGWMSVMEEPSDDDSMMYGYITDTVDVWVQYSDGTYPPELNINGDVQEFDDPYDYEIGERYRYTLSVDSDGDIEFTTYDYTNEKLDDMHISDTDVSSEQGKEFHIASDNAWRGHTNHFYSLRGSQSFHRIYTPIETDFEVSDVWKPNYRDDTDTRIDYDEMLHVGETGQSHVYNISNVNEEILSDTQNIQTFDSVDSMEFMAQTPEKNYESYFDSESYFQGWNNLESEIMRNLEQYVVRISDGESVDDVNIVDYYIEDLIIEPKYSGGYREKVREAYADAFLSTAEEHEWSLWLKSLQSENDTGWRNHTEYGDSGWFTVKELLDMNHLSVKEIQGNSRYGCSDRLREWSDSFTYQTFSFDVHGYELEEREHFVLSSDSGERDEIKQDIIDGNFGVDVGDEIDDITVKYQEIMEKMKDMEVSHFSIYQGTVADVAMYWDSMFGTGEYDSDRYLSESQHYQSTNLALSNILTAGVNETVTMSNYTDGIDEDFRMRISLSEMQQSFKEEFEERDDYIFRFMSLDDDRDTYGVANGVPLTVGTSEASRSMTVIIVVVILVGVMVVGSAMLYNKQNQNDRSGNNAKERK